MDHLPDVAGTAKRIRKRRVELGISQRQLAFPGCTYAYISRLESATRVPSRQVLEEIARRLGTTTHWLIYGKPDPVERGLLYGGIRYEALTGEERKQLEVSMQEALFVAAREFARVAAERRLEAEKERLRRELEALEKKEVVHA
jgi:transcriptional regulator with XRE-family HTH domain